MQHAARIGASLTIKGNISAKEPISVAGRVEGRIDVDGHGVMIEPGADIVADVSADSVVVAGSLQGTILAEQRIELRATAVVDGDVSAPRIAMEDGAILRGKVEAAGIRTPELARAS